jgi:signal transduction histidine kinase
MLADSENPITERSTVDLADVARHVTREAETAATEAGVSLTCTAEPAPTSGDPILLERLVQNLVENGIRHNRAGGWLTVRTGATADGVEVVVTNSGPVVAAYELEMIFEPFRRLAGDRSSRGLGLGLSIVAAVARAHGGRAFAVPNDGGGLIVTVRLEPAKDCAEPRRNP